MAPRLKRPRRTPALRSPAEGADALAYAERRMANDPKLAKLVEAEQEKTALRRVHRFSDLMRSRRSPKQIATTRAAVHAELAGATLRELRELIGKSQAEVARSTKMTRGDLSRQERRADHLVSTLRRYVEALGGELEVVARFGGKEIRLRRV